MLLELLSDFQITIPELGQIAATTMPIVVLTSNDSRELTEALKRRCLYLWLDYPELEREMEIVRLHAPELRRDAGPAAGRGDRDGPRPRPEEAALDRRVDRLGADAAADGRRGHRPRDLHPVDVDHRQAPHRHRPGGRAGRDETPAPTRPGEPDGLALRAEADAGPPGLAAKLLGFCEELRGEGVAVGTSEILDAFAALEQVDWTSQDDFREALAATIAKSQDDRRVFELLFDRYFFRAAEAEAVAARDHRARRGRRRRRGEGGERLDMDELREQIREAIASRRRGRDARPGAAGDRRLRPQGEGSGVVGVDVQRIRRTLGPHRRHPAADRGRRASGRRSTATSSTGFERHLRRELERDLIERTETLPPSRPLAELDRALPTSPTQDLAAVHRAVSQMKRRLATLGHEQRGRRKAPTVDVRRTMRASLETGGVPLRLQIPAEAAAAAGDLRPLRRLHLGHLGQRLLPLGPARPARLVPQTAQLRLHRADLRGDRRLRARARLRRRRPADLQRGRRRRRLRLHRLRPRLARVPDRDLRRPRPALDRDRARRRPHQRPRAPRRGLRPGRRARRPPLLAQPRAEALLELRRLGDGRLRALLRRRLRVLDHPPPGELRQRRRRRRRPPPNEPGAAPAPRRVGPQRPHAAPRRWPTRRATG